MDKPLTSKKDRDASAKPTKPAERTAKCSRNGKKRAVLRAKKFTQTIEAASQEIIRAKTCDYMSGGQACLHYSSVISRRRALTSLSCINKRPVGQGNIREVVADWNSDHNGAWSIGWMQPIGAKNNEDPSCERDEFPPAAIWQARDKNVWIRLSPRKGNGWAGSLFKGCPARVRKQIVGAATRDRVIQGCNKV